MQLGIVELIEQLKSELEQLQLSPTHLFTVEGVDLELKFVVERSVDATGKAHWVLFAAEAKGQYKDQQVNTIKLTLKPITFTTKDGHVAFKIVAMNTNPRDDSLKDGKI
jgi:Trypsin-co-occurring domain 2